MKTAQNLDPTLFESAPQAFPARQDLPVLRPASPGQQALASQPVPEETGPAVIEADAASILDTIRAVGAVTKKVIHGYPAFAHRLNRGGGLYDLVSNTTNFVTGTPAVLLRLAHLAVHGGAHFHEMRQWGWTPQLLYRRKRRAPNP